MTVESTETKSPLPSRRAFGLRYRGRHVRGPTESRGAVPDDTGTHAPRRRQRNRRRRAVSDLEVSLYLTLASAVLYALTARPDWNFDSLRFAEWTQSGELALLLRPFHVLGNLLPLAVYRGLRAVGYGGGSLPILTGVSVAGAAGAVGLTFMTGRKFGGTRVASAAAAGILGASYGVWGAGSAAGVYGVALFCLALGWFAAARYIRRPGPGRAALLGITAALAVAGSRGNTVFVVAAMVVVLGMALPDSTSRPRPLRARAANVGVFLLAGVATAAVAVAILVAVTPGGSLDSIRQGVGSWIDFLQPFTGASGSPDLVYGRFYGTVRAVAGWPIPPELNQLFPFEFSQMSSRIAGVLAAGLLLATVVRGGTLLARSGRPTVIGVALGLNATLALLAAALNSPSRVDHATLALVPLALLWPAAGPILSRRKLWPGRAALAVVTALVLAGWNLVSAVLPGVQEGVRRDMAIEGIARVAAPDATLVLSPQISPRAAYRGMNAFTGTFLLLERQTFPNRLRGIRSFLSENVDRPVFVSSRAFDAAPLGRGFIADVWSFLERCCVPRSSYRFVTSAGEEVLYRLKIDRARLAATPGYPPK